MTKMFSDMLVVGYVNCYPTKIPAAILFWSTGLEHVREVVAGCHKTVHIILRNGESSLFFSADALIFSDDVGGMINLAYDLP